MSDISVDDDQFAAALEGILTDVGDNVREGASQAIEAGLKVGQKEWKRLAPVKTGKYRRSITHHMLRKSGDKPGGEVGSRTLPGLPHLLEKGHASIGGGRPAAPIPHIAPAAEVAFRETEQVMERIVEEVLDG